MLAIMNVGKYSAPTIEPSGSNVLRVLKDISVSTSVKNFATNGERIIAIGTNILYYSDDNGENWSNVSVPYNIERIAYINYHFYAIETSATSNLHYGVSDDGITWSWEVFSNTSTQITNYFGHQITLDNSKVRFTYATFNYNDKIAYYQCYLGEEPIKIGEVNNPISSSIQYNVARNSIIIGFVYSLSGAGRAGVICSDNGVSLVSSSNAYENMWLLRINDTANDMFFYGMGSESTSSTSVRKLYYSSNGYNWQSELSDEQYSDGNKPYSYFKHNNIFYMTYRKNNGNSAVWARGASVPALINISSDEIETVSDVGLPINYFSIDNRKLLISTKDSHLYLCETP